MRVQTDYAQNGKDGKPFGGAYGPSQQMIRIARFRQHVPPAGTRAGVSGRRTASCIVTFRKQKD